MSEAGAPIIYEENRSKVLNALKDGRIDYLDLADWTFQDRFFAFLLGLRFFEICGASYPTPRKKEEVALWFLLACKVQMKLHTTAAFDELPGILRSGAVLSRVKFNVGGSNGCEVFLIHFFFTLSGLQLFLVVVDSIVHTC